MTLKDLLALHVLEADRFHELARKGITTPGDVSKELGGNFLVRKGEGYDPAWIPLATKAAIDAEQRTATFTISTQAEDRSRDIVYQDGLVNADEFLKSGVVLWGHDARAFAIADPVDLKSQKRRTVSTAKFATREASPAADSVFMLIGEGILKAASIGFQPEKWAFNEKRGGVDFFLWKLLEWSVVNIGDNQEALIHAAAKGIDLAPLAPWAEEALDVGTVKDGVLLIVPKGTHYPIAHDLRSMMTLHTLGKAAASQTVLVDAATATERQEAATAAADLQTSKDLLRKVALVLRTALDGDDEARAAIADEADEALKAIGELGVDTAPEPTDPVHRGLHDLDARLKRTDEKLDRVLTVLENGGSSAPGAGAGGGDDEDEITIGDDGEIQGLDPGDLKSMIEDAATRTTDAAMTRLTGELADE